MHSGLEQREGRPEHAAATKMEDVMVTALVRRNGLQIGLVPELDCHGVLQGGAITVALQHPAMGRLNKQHSGRVLADVGLEWLAFCRTMAKVMALQRELRYGGRRALCSVAAPRELLVDAVLRGRCAEWVADNGLPLADIRLHFGQRHAADLDACALQEIRAIQQCGFDIALDSASLDSVEMGALDVRRTTILVDRAAMAQIAEESGSGWVLKDKLAEMAANGATVVACGIASAHCEQIARRLGFKHLQGSHFPLSPDVARFLSAVNAE